MANHKSALKRHRQSVKHAERNRHYRTMVKTAIKRARTALEESSTEASGLVAAAISTIDRVKGKGIIPAKRASRYVSKLASKLKS